MKAEETPLPATPATRRKTRSAAVANNTVQTPKRSVTYTPSLNDLGFEGEPISYENLLSSFPGREAQILELVRLLGPLNSPLFPLFVYGSPSSGKTSVVLQVFRHLNRPFVYSSCRTCYNPRILFESILNQLLFHRKSPLNGYSNAKRCEKPFDFVDFVRDALTDVIKSLKEILGKSSSSKTAGKPNGIMIYLIFDDLELVGEWDKSSTMLPFLYNLHNILKMPEVGVIFISSSSPDDYYSKGMGFVEPMPVYFPEYVEDELFAIFMRNQANKKLYASFLHAVLRPFTRITRRVDELSAAFSELYIKYCEPLDDLSTVPNEDMKRRLFTHLQPQIAPSLNEIFRVQSQPSHEADANKGSRKIDSHLEKIDFHMSTSAKYLLISAFLASRNPATLDASMFDSTGGSDNRRRKRKASEKSMEHKDMAEQERLMKGPGSFPIERLLAIFQCISYAGESSICGEEEGNDGLGFAEGSNFLMPDVLLQLSSLCNANFILKGGSCPLEGSTRYRSTVSEDMALKVARSVKFPLSKYLYRR